MILHLVEADVWAATPPDGGLTPPSLATEGFVHCTSGDDVLLAVANRLHRDRPGEFVALSVDPDRLTSRVQWDPVDDPDAPAPEFPHIYGPLDAAAVVAVRRVTRDADGRFVGYGPTA